MHVISDNNCDEAVDAVRDILMMYFDMARDGGFSHLNNVYVRFDALKYIDAISDNKAFYVDLELLNAGSAVAFLSSLYDTWLETETTVASPADLEALERGTLTAFPDIEAVTKEALRRGHMPLEDTWFDDVLQPIYRKYVLAFFKRLSESDRNSGLS